MAAAPAGFGGGLRLGAQVNRQGVTVEATYTVGEYDIVILSARESGGLESWLIENGYKIPTGAAPILGSYIKQGMRFFVAKVNLQEQAALGFTFLRPLQVSYDTPKFMLPIRLGTVNAKGPQDLFVFAITRTGRVETTNYRTVKLPTGMDLPLFVKAEFKDFYKAMFAEQVRKEDMHAVFLEYAWNMSWCDPCAADPLSKDQLRKLGVAVDNETTPAFVSRLHARYDAAHFPEDLVFQETSNQENFQGRYVLRHPFTGRSQCLEATRYEGDLSTRREREAQNLAQLTGWKIEDIRRKAQGVKITDAARPAEAPWYRKVWAALTWD
jgi:hypothetical protein